MRKSIILKPHEAAALARGETITIWRAVKPQPEFCGANGEQRDINQWGWMTDESPSFLPVSKCNPFPLNVPLLGKETWAPNGVGRIIAAALHAKEQPMAYYRASHDGVAAWRWRSATSMPEWAVRTLVTLSNVWVSRPCDVTGRDAKMMGFKPMDYTKGIMLPPAVAFAENWIQIYGNGEEEWESWHWSYTATPTKKAP